MQTDQSHFHHGVNHRHQHTRASSKARSPQTKLCQMTVQFPLNLAPECWSRMKLKEALLVVAVKQWRNPWRLCYVLVFSYIFLLYFLSLLQLLWYGFLVGLSLLLLLLMLRIKPFSDLLTENKNRLTKLCENYGKRAVSQQVCVSAATRCWNL